MNESLNNNHDVGVAGQLEKMPNYKEHMKEMQSEKKISASFLEFEKKHPELAAEMRELDIPLNEKEFVEQGYSFYSSSKIEGGSILHVAHLRRETTDYRNWKKEHPGEEPPIEMQKYAPIDKSGISEALSQEDDDIEMSARDLRRERELLEEQIKAKEKFRSLSEDELVKSRDKMYHQMLGELFNNDYPLTSFNYSEGITRFIDKEGGIGSNAFDRLLVESDQDAARNFLHQTITIGAKYRYDWNGFGYRKNSNYFMYDKDSMDRMDRALEKYDVDTSDEGEYKRALVGFTNTLSGVNGEKTDQAKWYFESFKFAENWDSFLAAMGVVGEKRGVGFKRKLTMFLNTRAEWSQRNDKIKSEKEARKIASKNDFARLGNMREVNLDYVNAYVNALRSDADLDDDYFPVNIPTSEQFNDESVTRDSTNGSFAGNNGEEINHESRKAHDDEAYGKMKVVKLGDWCNYIQENVDADARFYIESIGAGDNRIRGEYLALQFTMNGKTYCIAESIKDNAAMYLASGEAGEDIREYFRTLSKQEARKDDHINVIYHLDKENFGDSLDQCYAKAFFLLLGGKKGQKDFGKTQIFPVG